MKAIVTGTGRMGKAILSLLAKVYPRETGVHSRDIERAKTLIRELHIDAKAMEVE
jgi:glutamyl-tRNA reductase